MHLPPLQGQCGLPVPSREQQLPQHAVVHVGAARRLVGPDLDRHPLALRPQRRLDVPCRANAHRGHTSVSAIQEGRLDKNRRGEGDPAPGVAASCRGTARASCRGMARARWSYRFVSVMAGARRSARRCQTCGGARAIGSGAGSHLPRSMGEAPGSSLPV
eukprot:246123-Chlamydomonas_euryale.AAC.1